MKLLVLGNSNDMARGEASETRAEAVARLIGEQTGEQVELMVRPIWPDGRLEERIEKWQDGFQPDAILLSIPGYWFLYESVPLKVQRSWGWFGRLVGGFGVSISDRPLVSQTRLSRALRKAALRVVGGATYFEPDDVLAEIEPCIRAIVSHESVALAVRGPQSSSWWTRTSHHRQWRARRSARVTAGLWNLCQSLSIPMVAERTEEERSREELESDANHRTGEAFAANCANDAAALLEAIRRAGIVDVVATGQ